MCVCLCVCVCRASLVAQMIKNLPALKETQVQPLGWEDTLEKGMTTLSNSLAWKNFTGKESDGLQSMGSQKVGHDWRTQHMHTHMLGAGVRTSTHGKGHEEGGSTYAKAGSSLRSPPGNSRASTPKTRVCLLYYFVLSPTPLTLQGAVPHHLFQRRS